MNNKTQKVPLANDFQKLVWFSPEFILNSHAFDMSRIKDLDFGVKETWI